jgi:hypothetical protein
MRGEGVSDTAATASDVEDAHAFPKQAMLEKLPNKVATGVPKALRISDIPPQGIGRQERLACQDPAKKVRYIQGSTGHLGDSFLGPGRDAILDP